MRAAVNIHDDVAHCIEGGSPEGLGEEVGHVLSRGDERHDQLLVLNALANVEVPSLDMLDLLVVLGVVRQVARRLVVRGERSGLRGAETQLVEEPAEVDALLGCLAHGHYLGLARRESDAGLLLTGPRDGRQVVQL